MIAHYLIGDVFDRMAELPDGSVDLVVTSPPFLALRSYLPADHPDKAKEIGSESTPAAFLDTMLALTAEWRRLLTPHGSICIELGDTYAGSGGAGGDYGENGLRADQERFDGSARRGRPATGIPGIVSPGGATGGGNGQARKGSGWPLDKSLCGIPTLYAWSLAYGRNLLTGQSSPAGQWRVRNLVAWVRPNPPVGALGDKFRPATSYVTVATIARDRYFDLDAVRMPYAFPNHPQIGSASVGNYKSDGSAPTGRVRTEHPAGAPPLDWWNITPGGYSGAHYATFPTELPKRLIQAMCPRRVCVTCGQPSRRIVEATAMLDGQPLAKSVDASARDQGAAHGFDHNRLTTDRRTLGWSDCGHDAWRPGMVLDSFAGSGTTLAVATGLGRDATGIDIDPRNADLARQRCGMFLEVIDHQVAP